MKLLGHLEPKASSEVTCSRFGLGFEKLDRAVFDPEKAYDRVAAAGVKWIRLQSGWARTETEKGVYHWEWMDAVVDNLLSRGLIPWVCLCYGNALYSEAAKPIFGAVGVPPIYTDEERKAWHDYVVAFVRHFEGRVSHYEVWNEPDGIWCWKQGVSAVEYGNFVCDTAKAVREVLPDAEIYGGVVCLRDLFYLDTALQTGMYKYINAITFHEYTADETKVFERVRALRALAHRYNPNLEIIQGESGSQSRQDGHGALRGMTWTPEKQAKQLLRHGVADLLANVKFSSYFSTMDMIEALNGTVGDTASYLDYGYFGILGADFDENGIASGEYTPKPSYYALQNLCAVFAGEEATAELPILLRPQEYIREYGNMSDYRGELISGGFRRPNGSFAFAYWNPTDLMTATYAHFTTFQSAALPQPVRLIDPMSGEIFALDEKHLVDNGNGQLLLQHIPLRDYPMILTFGDFVL